MSVARERVVGRTGRWHLTRAALEDVPPQRYAITAKYDESKDDREPATRVALEFALTSVDQQAVVTNEDVDQRCEHGFSDEDILELPSTAGMAAFASRWIVSRAPTPPTVTPLGMTGGDSRHGDTCLSGLLTTVRGTLHPTQ